MLRPYSAVTGIRRSTRRRGLVGGALVGGALVGGALVGGGLVGGRPSA